MKFNLQKIRNALDNYDRAIREKNFYAWPWSSKESVPEIVTTISRYCANIEALNKNSPLSPMQNYAFSKYLLELHDLITPKNRSLLEDFELEINADFIYASSAYESVLASILIQHDIYSFENFQKITAHARKSELLNALIKVRPNLSDDLFQLVVTHKNVTGLGEAAVCLQQSNVPEEYHRRVYQHPNPFSMAEALDTLQQNNTLNDEWISRIESYRKPKELLLALFHLPEQLLTQKNIELISLSEYPDQVTASIKTLHSAGLWNDASYKYFTNYLEKYTYYNHEASIFGVLHSIGLLTFPYLTKVFEHRWPEDFADALRFLHTNQLMEYLPNVFSHPMPILAANLIKYLFQNHGVNKNTLQWVQETTNQSATCLSELTTYIPYDETTFRIFLKDKSTPALVVPFVDMYKANIRDKVSKEIVADSADPKKTVKTLIDLQSQNLLSADVLLALKKELPKKNHRNLFLFDSSLNTKTDGGPAPQFPRKRASFG